MFHCSLDQICPEMEMPDNCMKDSSNILLTVAQRVFWHLLLSLFLTYFFFATNIKSDCVTPTLHVVYKGLFGSSGVTSYKETICQR